MRITLGLSRPEIPLSFLWVRVYYDNFQGAKRNALHTGTTPVACVAEPQGPFHYRPWIMIRRVFSSSLPFFLSRRNPADSFINFHTVREKAARREQHPCPFEWLRMRFILLSFFTGALVTLMELKSTARAFKRGNRKEDKWSLAALAPRAFSLLPASEEILMCQLHTFTLSAANSRRWKGDGHTKRPSGALSAAGWMPVLFFGWEILLIGLRALSAARLTASELIDRRFFIQENWISNFACCTWTRSYNVDFDWRVRKRVKSGGWWRSSECTPVLKSHSGESRFTGFCAEKSMKYC